MRRHYNSGRFRDFTEFFGAIDNWRELSNDCECRWVAPFVDVRAETYRLFGRVELRILEILPSVDIYIPYECDSNCFSFSYCVDGNMMLQDRYHGDSELKANWLSCTSMTDMKGNHVFRKNKSFKGVALVLTGEAMRGIVGEPRYESLSEALSTDNPYSRKNVFLGDDPPPDIASSFLQIANCRYPAMSRQFFFESKFMEIMSRIIAHNLPVDDGVTDMGEFETEQIKKIPGILMKRIDTPPSIPELAHELSLSGTAMKSGFKKIFGEPIYAHHRNLCLERAAIMLLNANKSILQIAIDAGYANGENFCNAFKKRYGLSPSQYRRKGKPSSHSNSKSTRLL
ncbi:MAG: AraC family transcriptional regulator [Synergistaceae bacterium]|nr:AraC family transcriptional regulator [Synergistaceae bacterium]